MKITPSRVKWFEKEQQEWGTKVALHNLLWLVGSAHFNDLGVKTLTTKYFKDSRRSATR